MVPLFNHSMILSYFMLGRSKACLNKGDNELYAWAHKRALKGYEELEDNL